MGGVQFGLVFTGVPGPPPPPPPHTLIFPAGTQNPRTLRTNATLTSPRSHASPDLEGNAVAGVSASGTGTVTRVSYRCTKYKVYDALSPYLESDKVTPHSTKITLTEGDRRCLWFDVDTTALSTHQRQHIKYATHSNLNSKNEIQSMTRCRKPRLCK
jgi:hypothetical protein